MLNIVIIANINIFTVEYIKHGKQWEYQPVPAAPRVCRLWYSSTSFLICLTM